MTSAKENAKNSFMEAAVEMKIDLIANLIARKHANLIDLNRKILYSDFERN